MDFFRFWRHKFFLWGSWYSCFSTWCDVHFRLKARMNPWINLQCYTSLTLTGMSLSFESWSPIRASEDNFRWPGSNLGGPEKHMKYFSVYWNGYMNLGGQSGSTECQNRWSGGEIRWPWPTVLCWRQASLATDFYTNLFARLLLHHEAVIRAVEDFLHKTLKRV